MTVTCGELRVKLDGRDAFITYPAGTNFEIGPNSGFTVQAEQPAAYYCEYL